MPPGRGGRYDRECETVFAGTQADLVVVIVVNGAHGSGFSVTTRDRRLLSALPDLLVQMTAEVRASLPPDETLN